MITASFYFWDNAVLTGAVHRVPGGAAARNAIITGCSNNGGLTMPFATELWGK